MGAVLAASAPVPKLAPLGSRLVALVPPSGRSDLPLRLVEEGTMLWGQSVSQGKEEAAANQRAIDEKGPSRIRGTLRVMCVPVPRETGT